MGRWLLSLGLLAAVLGSWPFALGADDKPAAPPAKKQGLQADAKGNIQFREGDSNDDRWKRTDHGPFLSSMLNYGPGRAVRGVAVHVGDKRQATMLFDEAFLSVCAGWTGEFLQFNSVRFGLMNPPLPGKPQVFNAGKQPGWGKGTGKYRGLYVQGERVVFAYEMEGAAVLESPWAEETAAGLVFTRTLEMAPHEHALTCVVAQGAGKVELQNVDGVRLGTVKQKDDTLAVAVHPAAADLAVVKVEEGALVVSFPAAKDTVRTKVCVWAGPHGDVAKFAAAVKGGAPPEDLKKLTEPGPRRWGEPLVTRGRLGDNKGPYTVDTLTLPFENPCHALLFTGGHDFFSDGRAAVCTAHGDVWLVSGIDEKLEKLTWQRFATGLYQPLGLRIVKDAVYVLCRDQIVRLHDKNADGEADYYECFSSANPTSPSGHDYAACLESDAAGNFYFIQAARKPGAGGYGVGGVYRVSPDGKEQTLVAEGFRNAIGLGVGGSDIITAAPQEGEWTPGSGVFEIKPGQFYGYGGPQVTPERPLGYDPPLVWFPRAFDNSSGGQVWTTGERFGPLNNQLIHLSYGRCWPLLVLRDTVEGVTQGASVKLNLDCESGIMRGRMNPKDGQLYVTGLRGWQTSAAQDGCLERIRYTGAKCYLPTSWRVQANGIVIGFNEPLDKEAAEDAGNYAAEQWNYQYRAQYGSPEFKVSDAKVQGRDAVPVRSATLLPDGKSLFVELGEVKPVMQLALRLSIVAADGAAIDHEIVGTVHRVPTARIEPGPRQPQSDGLADDVRARLKPGLMARFQRGSEKTTEECRVERLAAFTVPLGTAPAAFLSPVTRDSAAFRALFEGYLQVPVNGSYRFQVASKGESSLTLNGNAVALAGDKNAPSSATVRLKKGYNRVQWTVRVPEGAAFPVAARLLWSGKGFDWEPIPPTSLAHDLAEKGPPGEEQLELGRELYATHNCHLCHRSPEGLKQSVNRMPELEADPPTLSEVAARIQPDWSFRWMLDPATLRSHTTMPRVLRAAEESTRRKQAADLTAYLGTLGPKASADPPPRTELIDRGEALYENLGCIACHRFTPPAEKDAADRVSLHFMAAKFIPAALVTYLRSPHRNHSGSRMPDFHLSPEEGEALAAYVLKNAEGKIEHAVELDTAEAAAGRQLFISQGCKHCHNLGPTADDELRKLPEAKLAGCLDAKGATSAPDFGFSEEQRSALAKFLKSDLQALANDPPAEFAERAYRRYRCGACHSRDGVNAAWPRLAAEEGSLGTPPEQVPDLTWAGEKLKTRWLEQLLAGEHAYRARPWLTARMPSFANGAGRLALGLACEHGLEPREAATKPDPELVELGRQLTLKEQGLDCRQCHGLETRTAKQDNNAQGISFLHVPERVRRGYYDRWLLDPLRIDPGSRMPKFAADGQHTTVRHILEGDADKQFDALWQYIQSVPQQK